jgi:uncharacterized protein (DUF608 family)
MPSCSSGKYGAPCCSSKRYHGGFDNNDDDDNMRQLLERSTGQDDVNDSDNDTQNLTKDPWVYSGKHLQALNFPLGGFGTGNILLQGDGSLQGWTIQNQFHNSEYTPLHKLPGNMFVLTGTILDDNDNNVSTPKSQTVVLQSSENYSHRNQQLHFREEAHVSHYQVSRLQKFPHVPTLKMKCRYPIATIDYTMPFCSDDGSNTFPIAVQCEAMTPFIPTNTKDSSYPVAVFTFTVTNASVDKNVSIDLMQSTMNFI